MAHGRRITIFKFDIYLLMMTDKIFIVILGLLGHNRMGKTCAPKMFGFLRHPNSQPFISSVLLVSQIVSKFICKGSTRLGPLKNTEDSKSM